MALIEQEENDWLVGRLLAQFCETGLVSPDVRRVFRTLFERAALKGMVSCSTLRCRLADCIRDEEYRILVSIYGRPYIETRRKEVRAERFALTFEGVHV